VSLLLSKNKLQYAGSSIHSRYYATYIISGFPITKQIIKSKFSTYAHRVWIAKKKKSSPQRWTQSNQQPYISIKKPKRIWQVNSS